MLKLLKTPYSRYALDESQSPTHYNLCRHLQEQSWQPSRFSWRSGFSDRNLQFDLRASQCLEYKHLLAELVSRYCPQVMPLTYSINDLNWPVVLNQIANQFYLENHACQGLVWILKPALLNNGHHIHIFQSLSDIERHFLGAGRLGGEHVLQQYLTDPHLLRPPQGHKYSIRMFVVITNYAGAYLYPQGYFNVALQPFQSQQFLDLRSHLTNEHLSQEEANVVQIPSRRFDFFAQLYPQIKAITELTINGLRQQYPQAFSCNRQRTLAIFGFDFLVDKNWRVWLLEANHGPCFPVGDEHPLQQHLYDALWQAFIRSFVLPIAHRQPIDEISYDKFEPIAKPVCNL
ncbi:MULTISPECIES: tubulin-tyrosine ligase [unclassified Legionella]|uniref:tubulin-tyrosine ligase n=1 Tax=unclassified Legionella TaxID=2622702 RepID=UPI001055E8FF|nr:MULTISPECIES: tubulin-tyrosine ligase [unclassified Legionella]MDI9819047.1 tubulin-tyrosine ligase [Legionella sp. PL877]